MRLQQQQFSIVSSIQESSRHLPPQEPSDAPTSEATEGVLDLSVDNNSEEDEIPAGEDIVNRDLGGDLGALDASVSDEVEEE
ncbi:hypothetical protein BGX21_007641, partial [Mortierella sp. AD011]